MSSAEGGSSEGMGTPWLHFGLSCPVSRACSPCSGGRCKTWGLPCPQCWWRSSGDPASAHGGHAGDKNQWHEGRLDGPWYLGGTHWGRTENRNKGAVGIRKMFRGDGKLKGEGATNGEISISKKPAKIKYVGNQPGNSVHTWDDWFVSHSQHRSCTYPLQWLIWIS